MPAATAILEIPEIAGLDARGGLIRIPPELDVPLTPRVRRIIDTPQFRRLAKVRQLGLVSLVYPGATHSRFEHALGAYRLALLFLKRLAHDERFAAAVTPRDAERLIVAALLHDVGHWPFCHAIEDLRLAGVPTHETLAAGILAESELADALREGWRLEPGDIAGLLSHSPSSDCHPERSEGSRGSAAILRCAQNDSEGAQNANGNALASRILGSLLSGPIDFDKMDYLARDSLHAGVPYGRNFDQARLIGSLCLNGAGDGLAITEKGKTAAEMMVFSRYVMFSEVYWHHGVRAATAMVQRAFYLRHSQFDLAALLRLDDDAFVAWLAREAGESPAGQLLAGLFGPTRRLYKRVAQFSIFEQRELHEKLARRPYPSLAACAAQFAARAAAAIGDRVEPHEILFDAPPQEREVEFRVDVYYPKEDRYRPLGEVSPVVRTLAHEQFDDYVKRVRLFAPVRLAARLRSMPELTALLLQAIEAADS